MYVNTLLVIVAYLFTIVISFYEYRRCCIMVESIIDEIRKTDTTSREDIYNQLCFIDDVELIFVLCAVPVINIYVFFWIKRAEKRIKEIAEVKYGIPSEILKMF